MVSTSEAARLLSVSERRVQKLVEEGRLKAEKVSGVWLIDEDSVRERLRTVRKTGGRPRRGEGRAEARFTLMNRTHEIMEVVYDRDRAEFTFLGEPTDARRAPLCFGLDARRLSLVAFNRWWRDRGIPGTRAGLASLLAECRVAVPAGLVWRNLGLSLSDQYWVRPAGSGLRWEDVNFFNNSFNEVDGRTACFAACGSVGEGAAAERMPHAHPDNTSDGNLGKTWFIRNGVRLLRKFGLRNNQEPYNEVAATALYRRLLAEGEFVPYALEGAGAEASCVCANFLADDEEYVPALYVARAAEQPPERDDYHHYLACCDLLGASGVKGRLDKMIACDDVLANSDRHWRNFGLVRNVETLACRPAPIFDSGTSLWCQTDLADLARGERSFTSKQFFESPARQMLLVDDFAWLDPERLRGFADEALEILAGNDMLANRLPYLEEALSFRIRRILDIAEWS